MAIKASDILSIDLPAGYWEWLLAVAQSVPAPHKESDPVIRALSAKMMDHIRRDAEPSVEPSPE